MPDTQISEEMVERAARALFPSDFNDRHGDNCLDCKEARDEARTKARAALEAALSGHVVGWQQAAMAQFIMWCMNEGPWDGCDLYGGDVQDKAEELGLIVKTKFDPKIHGQRIEAKEGGDWFVPAEWLLSALPAPPVTAVEGLGREDVRMTQPSLANAEGRRWTAYHHWMWFWCWFCYRAYLTVPIADNHQSRYGKFTLWLLGYAGGYAYSTRADFHTCSYFRPTNPDAGAS